MSKVREPMNLRGLNSHKCLRTTTTTVKKGFKFFHILFSPWMFPKFRSFLCIWFCVYERFILRIDWSVNLAIGVCKRFVCTGIDYAWIGKLIDHFLRFWHFWSHVYDGMDIPDHRHNVSHGYILCHYSYESKYVV